MGACQFEVTSRGKTAEEAYRKACERAEDEYGHQDGYNGTISTTAGFRDETEAYHKSKFDDTDNYISNRFDSMNKYDCSAICVRKPIGNKNKTQSQVEHVVTPGTKKWVLKYVVQRGDHFIGSWDTKGDAVKDARRYTENHQVTTSIVMKKFLEKGDNLVAKITYKKSPTERDGEWIFFGYAAE
jgi:Holliday junction resolvase RusA-like endonuclease